MVAPASTGGTRRQGVPVGPGARPRGRGFAHRRTTAKREPRPFPTLFFLPPRFFKQWRFVVVVVVPGVFRARVEPVEYEPRRPGRVVAALDVGDAARRRDDVVAAAALPHPLGLQRAHQSHPYEPLTPPTWAPLIGRFERVPMRRKGYASD